MLLVGLATEGRHWAGLARVLPKPGVAVGRAPMSYEIPWQGYFSSMVTHSGSALPGNPSDNCSSDNLKYLKKSDGTRSLEQVDNR